MVYERISERCYKKKGLAFGAFDKKELVGAIFVDINDRPKAWLFFFDVKKSYRGRGVGNLLLKKVEDNLPTKYTKLYTDLEKTDKSGLKFYKDHGFKRKAKIKDWFGKGTYGLIYSKINLGEIEKARKLYVLSFRVIFINSETLYTIWQYHLVC